MESLKKENGKIPDFIICGFQKCGTSSLSQNLNQHPKIQIARTDHKFAEVSSGKEFNFFSSEKIDVSTYYEGIEWYKSHFKKDGNIWGEVSPNYTTFTRDVLQNMKPHISDTKFIFSIRNPIYRSFSAYNHYIQLAEEGIKWGNWEPNKTFLFNLKNHPYSFISNYYEEISLYIEAFGKNNIHILIQEQLDSNNFQNQYNNIFNFLKIEHHPINNQKIHARNYSRSIYPKEKEYLYELLKDDVEKLFNLIGREIQAWSEFC
tara:strand:- start:157 stop:939 length:783 start_codon:yes stop_codon:yes gene_type:complete